jgi:tRNA (guanine37-N1)-methyltransferase
MKFTVLSLFPQLVDSFFSTSVLGKAVESGRIEYRALNIRDYALDKHHSADDAPFGGGAGMLMLCATLAGALEAAGARKKDAGGGVAGPRVIYATPQGAVFTQKMAAEFSREAELVLLCGHYEGIDQRIIDAYVSDEVSIGDYVLSGGELAALVIADAVCRLVDGVIAESSLAEESFALSSNGRRGLLEYPQYTRPEIFDGMRVPEVLLSGHHENIRKWRLEESVKKTAARRPDLIERGLREGWFDAELEALIAKAR